MEEQSKNFSQVDRWILSYINKDITRDELSALKDYAKAGESNRKYIRERLEVWFSTGVAGVSKVDVEKAIKRFEAKVYSYEQMSGRLKRLKRWTIWSAAAAVALLMIIPTLTYFRGSNKVKESFADIEISTPAGSTTRLTLPDGSSVWLNNSSRIVYSQGFGVTDRVLKLEGEGYFDVEHNEDLPFEISTDDINLRVLGTQFNLRNYSEDESVSVTLIKGSVRLDNNHNTQSLNLAPNEQMVFDKATNQMRKISVNASMSNSWTHNVLSYDDVTLQQIVNDLMRAYNVKIEMPDEIKDYTFYGTFNKETDSVEDILGALALADQMSYTYQNGKYILAKKE